MIKKLIAKSVVGLFFDSVPDSFDNAHEWTYNCPEEILGRLEQVAEASELVKMLMKDDGSDRKPIAERKMYLEFLLRKFKGNEGLLTPLLSHKADGKSTHIFSLATHFELEVTKRFFELPNATAALNQIRNDKTGPLQQTTELHLTHIGRGELLPSLVAPLA